MDILTPTPQQQIGNGTKKQISKDNDDARKLIVKDNGELKSYSEIYVSTRTAVVVTNCFIDLEKLFENIPIAQYEPVQKRRGRKKRVNIERPIPKLPFGSVVSAQYEQKARGTLLKPQNEHFLHCVVIYIVIDPNQAPFGENNFPNVKIYTNGKLHITGCKSDDDYVNAFKAVLQLFDTIKQYTGEDVIANKPSTYTALFNTVMQNIDFYIGFGICRESLDRYIKKYTNYNSIYEGSISPGVSVKIPVSTEKDERLVSLSYDPVTKQMERAIVNLEEHKSFFVRKNKNRDRYHTFRIYASGNIIFTSAGSDMEDVYNNFVSDLIKNKEHFEETLSNE